MQSVNLPLFEFETIQSPVKQEPISKPEKIAEEKIVVPLTQVLDHATPSSPTKQKLEQSRSFLKSLEDLFPEQQYDEKDIQKARAFLGPIAEEFTAEQLKVAVTEINFLAESWLDDFERSIFEGKTLKELLHDKGGI